MAATTPFPILRRCTSLSKILVRAHRQREHVQRVSCVEDSANLALLLVPSHLKVWVPVAAATRKTSHSPSIWLPELNVLSNKGAAVAGADRLAVRRPLGMASPGYWLLDSTGMQVAFAGLNMTARDFAKLGDLYRTGGVWQGRQIVTAS